VSLVEYAGAKRSLQAYIAVLPRYTATRLDGSRFPFDELLTIPRYI